VVAGNKKFRGEFAVADGGKKKKKKKFCQIMGYSAIRDKKGSL